ncbi:hypothetical protein VTO42DRAFT_6337 [Malbranchea cinnamomea]
MALLEIACFNRSSALVAQTAGADRIEFCDNMAVGGITPSLDLLLEIRNSIKIPVYVMIRPRGGNFVYTEGEFETMKSDLVRFKEVADGFVFGILDSNGNVDVERNRELVELAQQSPCTFHRAFDETMDPASALEDVIRCGFEAVLTSGGQTSALAGIDMLSKLVEQAKDRIEIMPGGGVRSSNVWQLKARTGARWYHSSAITQEGDTADAVEIENLKIQLRQAN